MDTSPPIRARPSNSPLKRPSVKAPTTATTTPKPNTSGQLPPRVSLIDLIRDQDQRDPRQDRSRTDPSKQPHRRDIPKTNRPTRPYVPPPNSVHAQVPRPDNKSAPADPRPRDNTSDPPREFAEPGRRKRGRDPKTTPDEPNKRYANDERPRVVDPRNSKPKRPLSKWPERDRYRKASQGFRNYASNCDTRPHRIPDEFENDGQDVPPTLDEDGERRNLTGPTYTKYTAQGKEQRFTKPMAVNREQNQARMEQKRNQHFSDKASDLLKSLKSKPPKPLVHRGFLPYMDRFHPFPKEDTVEYAYLQHRRNLNCRIINSLQGNLKVLLTDAARETLQDPHQNRRRASSTSFMKHIETHSINLFQEVRASLSYEGGQELYDLLVQYVCHGIRVSLIRCTRSDASWGLYAPDIFLVILGIQACTSVPREITHPARPEVVPPFDVPSSRRPFHIREADREARMLPAHCRGEAQRQAVDEMNSIYVEKARAYFEELEFQLSLLEQYDFSEILRHDIWDICSKRLEVAEARLTELETEVQEAWYEDAVDVEREMIADYNSYMPYYSTMARHECRLELRRNQMGLDVAEEIEARVTNPQEESDMTFMRALTRPVPSWL